MRYRHQAEVRLVIIGQVIRFRGKRSKRLRNGKTAPYIPFDMPLCEPGTISEIVMGPASKLTEAKVKRALKSAGIDYAVPVRRSRITSIVQDCLGSPINRREPYESPQRVSVQHHASAFASMALGGDACCWEAAVTHSSVRAQAGIANRARTWRPRRTRRRPAGWKA